MKTYYLISCSQQPILDLEEFDLKETIEEAQVELKQFQNLKNRLGDWKIFKVTVEECPS